MKKEITVFTPIYNRAYCISQLYESLKNQSVKNFEWIVVDDGSTDNTVSLFDEWINTENEFPIIYIKTKNGGKMKALNLGVRNAQAPAFFIVDSDDTLTIDALEKVEDWFNEVKDNKDFAGVSGLRRIGTIDTKYDFDYIDTVSTERRKYGLIVDMAECFKTSILRKYPAPEIDGENYLPPNVLWNTIADAGYKIRYYNEYIYNCEYRKDGLSAQGMDKFYNNPIGWGLMIQQDIKRKNDSVYTEFQYWNYCQHTKEKINLEEISQNLDVPKKELKRHFKEIPAFIKKINEYFEINGIEKIALYGLGGEAKRYLSINSFINAEIIYGIDRRKKEWVYPCYTLEDELPEVDAILVTNRVGGEKIKEDIRKITKCRIISIQTELVDKGFNYYFSSF